MNRAISRATWAAAAALILAIPGRTGRAEEAKPVTVVNPPSVPVPVAVQGTTAVTGQVQVTNEPIVRLRNPTVTVGNVVAVKPIERVPIERFVGTASLEIGPSPDWLATKVVGNQVPAGKVLVIDQVSVSVDAAPKTVPRLEMEISDSSDLNSPVKARHFIALHDAGPVADDDHVFGATQSLKLYAFAGEYVRLLLWTQKSGTDGRCAASVWLSGYFLPAE